MVLLIALDFVVVAYIIPTGKTNNMSNNDNNNKLSSSYISTYNFLCGVIYVVTLYAVGMVLGGRSFATPIFDLLQFGPNTHPKLVNLVGGTEHEAFIDYCIFMFGVVGSVIIGWMVVMYQMLKLCCLSPSKEIREMGRNSILLSTIAWFTFDTGFSIVINEYEHAAFNIPFVTLLIVPILLMKRYDTIDDNDKRK